MLCRDVVRKGVFSNGINYNLKAPGQTQCCLPLLIHNPEEVQKQESQAAGIQQSITILTHCSVGLPVRLGGTAKSLKFPREWRFYQITQLHNDPYHVMRNNLTPIHPSVCPSQAITINLLASVVV